MPISKSIKSVKSVQSPRLSNTAINLVRREAKKMQHAAVSDSIAVSLPVLRRLLASKVLQGITLPELGRQRNIVQRKHVLRTLAIEAGYSSWEDYRHALAGMTPESLQHYDIARLGAGYPNLWFSSLTQAQAHAAVHGGRPIPVGQQAVVFVNP